MAKATRHGQKRLKQRTKLKHDELPVILEKGIRAKDLKGDIRRYLDRMAIIHRSTPVIYNTQIFCFGGEKLITVLPLPTRFHKYILSRS